MGWVENEGPCQHPGRPTPTSADVNRVWECDTCGKKAKVIMVDYGHDVMPGERQVDYVWMNPTVVRSVV